MAQENTDDAAEEPPDPFQRPYNPQNLNYELNGQGQSWRPVPFEESTGPDGRKFIRKIGTNIIYQLVKDSPVNYLCVSCNEPTDYIMTSRTIRRNLGQENHIRCEPHRYCPRCEPKPEKRNLEAIDESELFKQ